ncbi:MAG TPA: HAD family phosphatase [Bacteroidia bacterium]|jgi:putative hydrolase of the HAD superfamily|nr:HAD family phosphatase [Bacteroidia bacterium]
MIQNIILDLGGVIIDLDASATTRAFEQLGMKDFRSHYSFAKQSGVFDLYDKGMITDAEFRNELRKGLPEGVSDEQLDRAWNAMLLNVPSHRLEFLSSLRDKYRTFLLSNTNEIHVAAFSGELFRMHRVRDFSNYFENCYYSCRIGMRKPDKEIFEFVLRENGLRADETIFIDDSPQHVEGAKKAGIKAELLPAGMEVKTLLEKIL